MSAAEHSLAGRVVLITGAGGGLGAAVARGAAAAGAEIILCGRRLQPLESVYDTIIADGGPQPALFPVDFTKAGADDYHNLAEGIASDCGRLDGIVHLAARFDGLRPVADLPVADWQRLLHVNLTAPFAVTQACLPLLSQAEDASVVFAADPVGREAMPFWGAYGVAKAGLETLMRLLAAEIDPEGGLRINAVEPGPLRTGLRAKAFPTEDQEARPPQAAVPAILELLGPASRGVNGRLVQATADA